MPPIVDSINKSHNNRHNPIYPSAILDQVKKLGKELLEVCNYYKYFLGLNIEHLSNSYRSEVKSWPNCSAADRYTESNYTVHFSKARTP